MYDPMGGKVGSNQVCVAVITKQQGVSFDNCLHLVTQLVGVVIVKTKMQPQECSHELTTHTRTRCLLHLLDKGTLP